MQVPLRGWLIGSGSEEATQFVSSSIRRSTGPRAGQPNVSKITMAEDAGQARATRGLRLQMTAARVLLSLAAVGLILVTLHDRPRAAASRP